MNKTVIFIIVALLIAAALGYFAYTRLYSKTITTAPSVEKTAAAIVIQNFKFESAQVTVKPGETVSVTNQDLMGHTVSSDEAGLFDTGLIGQAETKTFTAPTTPGSYPFHCSAHPSMKAVLVVKD